MNENEQSKSAAATPPAAPPRKLTGASLGTVQRIPLELLHRSPYQVRREENVDELAADIRAHGLVNPITVRVRREGDGFEVVAGHRRWAALRAIDPEGDAPCIVLDVDDRTAEELLVAENFVRADLSIMEQAETVALLTEHGRTAEECGKVCRRSVRWAHRMRAIGGIGEPWRGFLHVAGLPYSCALAVARLPEAVREDAWRAYCEDLALDLADPDADADQRSVVTGQVECLLRDPERGLAQGAAAAFEVARSWLASHAADEQLRERLRTPAGARAFLEESPENGPRFSLDDTGGPLGGVLARFHALRNAPFDAAGCAGCARRSDAAPDLWGEDDGKATPARCLDCECWARKVGAHVRAEIEQARKRGVSAAAVRSSGFDWRDKDSLDAAIEAAGGDASRVVPVVRVFGDEQSLAGKPTGRMLWRVVEPEAEGAEDAEDAAATQEPPPKREPWQEWRPENPNWMPALCGDKRDRAWFAVGMATGVLLHDDEREVWVRHELAEAGEAALHLVVRSNWPDVPWSRREVLIAELWRLLDAPAAEALLDAKQVYLAAVEAAKGGEDEA